MTAIEDPHGISTQSENTEGSSFTSLRRSLAAIIAFALLLSTAIGITGVLVLQRMNDQLLELQRMALYVHIFMYLCFVLICILGLFGVITKRPGLTSSCITIIIGQLLFSIGSGVLCLYLLFNNLPSQGDGKCLMIAADFFTRNFCQRTTLVKGLAVSSLGQMWLVEIAIIFVGNSFLSQLREEMLQLEMLNPKYDREGSDC